MKKLKILAGKTEYRIGFAALVIWLLFKAGGVWLGWATFPFGYFQKIAFGILAASIITATGWIWFEATFLNLKKKLDPDSHESEKLTLWQQFVIGFSFYCLYVLAAVLLASWC